MGKMRKSIFEIRDIYIRKIVHLKSSQIQSIAHIPTRDFVGDPPQ